MLRNAAAGMLVTLMVAYATASLARSQPQQPTSAVKEFTVVAERYAFTPSRIEVNEGDRVRITLKSADGTHGFAIRRLKVQQEIPKGGTPVTVEFVADQPGTFEIKCSEYCGRGHSDMKATLVVSPRTAEGGKQ